MSEMITYRLGDVVRFVNGRAYSMPEMLEKGKYRIVRVGNFTGKDEWYYSDMELDEEKYCEKGDLLYKWACTFGPEVWEEEKAIFHYHIWKVIPNEIYIDKDYLYYVLLFMTNGWLKAAHGSTMVHITKEIMEDNTITIPKDVKVQRQIAAVLANIDRKIALNNSICSDLESMAKLLYDYWFVQFDFPDKNGNPYKSSGGKMVYNEELKRNIPEEWEVVNLKGRYQIERGISYTSKDIESGKGVAMINLACVDRDRNYREGELKYYSGKISDADMVEPFDLMIACTDLTREREIVGCPILVPADENDYTYSMDMAKIHFTDDAIEDLYMYAALRTDFYHEYIKRWASGTNVLHLNLEGLDWYNIYIPDISLQKKYAELIKNVHAEKSKMLSENKQLTELRNFLLPMLMNGQIKIGA